MTSEAANTLNPSQPRSKHIAKDDDEREGEREQYSQ